MQTNRLNWVDYIKATAIYCVILLHIGIHEPYREIINIFVIPTFFFLSGVFSRPERYKNYFDFFRQKGIRILIPYFFFNSVTYLFWLLIGRHYGLDNGLEIHPLVPLKGIFIGTSQFMLHNVPLWFLACLFSVESIFYLIFKKTTSIERYFVKIIPLIVIGYLIYRFNTHSLAWGIDIAFSMIVFYSSGHFLREKLLKKDINILHQIGLLLVASLLIFIVYKLNDDVKVFANYYGNYLYFLIGAFSGIVFCVSFFKLIDVVFKPINFLLFTGKSTLIILALHLIASSFLKAIMVYVLKIDYALYQNNTFYTLAFGIMCIVVLVPVIHFINKFLPFVVGKKNTTKHIFKSVDY